jgi:predicted nucleic acid-binding protein
MLLADWKQRHAGQSLGVTEASVNAVTERLGVTRIATLDRRFLHDRVLDTVIGRYRSAEHAIGCWPT